ncbi:hypothetical protein BASA83_006354 [Batrachochytrium salamandrivorans]|nr:hypothetical protein BASA83_006354 [Batrachochytrium salamandrivorans]
MNDLDEAIIRAIKQGTGPGEPDGEPLRMGSDVDSDENASDEDSQGGVAASSMNTPVDPDMARLLEDSALRQQLGVGGSFTGPKGVVNDYKFHKRQELARVASRQQTNVKKWSDRALSSGWLQRQIRSERGGASQATADTASSYRSTAQNSDEISDEDLDELEFDDTYIKEYRSRRILELQAQSVRPRFCSVQDLQLDDYVDAIDNEDPSVTVAIHLYKSTHEPCRRVNTFLDRLAIAYPTIKFAKIISTVADAAFDDVALPALLIYEAGSLTHTLLRITDDVPGWAGTGRISFESFESYLWDMGVLKESESSLARSLCKLAMKGELHQDDNGSQSNRSSGIRGPLPPSQFGAAGESDDD